MLVLIIPLCQEERPGPSRSVGKMFVYDAVALPCSCLLSPTPHGHLSKLSERAGEGESTSGPKYSVPTGSPPPFFFPPSIPDLIPFIYLYFFPYRSKLLLKKSQIRVGFPATAEPMFLPLRGSGRKVRVKGALSAHHKSPAGLPGLGGCADLGS